MSEEKTAVCSVCGGENDRNSGKRQQSKCTKCHAAYMREWRKANPLSGDALKRAKARSYSKTLEKRGWIVKLPCEKCGAKDVEKHHPDYDKPWWVQWLCRPCHLEHHKNENVSHAPNPQHAQEKAKPKMLDSVSDVC